MVEIFSEFWADFSRPEHLVGHIAYFFLILSMLMRSMNWLRVFAITAGTISVIYYTILDDKVSMFWEGMFTLVNLGQFLILTIENRRGKFSADEAAFIKSCLADVERANARRLMKLGAWVEVKEDAILVTEETCPEDLKYIVGGTAVVSREGRKLGVVSNGDYLGEMSYLTGEPATATVVVEKPVRYLSFERKKLKEFLAKTPEIRHALEGSFNRNLVEKLVKSNNDRTANGG